MSKWCLGLSSPSPPLPPPLPALLEFFSQLFLLLLHCYKHTNHPPPFSTPHSQFFLITGPLNIDCLLLAVLWHFFLHFYFFLKLCYWLLSDTTQSVELSKILRHSYYMSDYPSLPRLDLFNVHMSLKKSFGLFLAGRLFLSPFLAYMEF